MGGELDDGRLDDPLAVAEFELTPEEWVEAGTAYLFEHDLHRANRAKQRRIYAAMGVTMAALFYLVGALAGVVAALIAFTGLWIAAPTLYRRLLHRSLAGSARHGMVDGLFGPHRLEVRREFLRDVTSGYETRWRWKNVRGVGENEGTFLIKVGPTALIPLPASAFRDAESLRRFGDAFFAQVAGARAALDPAGRIRHG
jgi:hypothetical protein